jgi:exoribonuclease R
VGNPAAERTAILQHYCPVKSITAAEAPGLILTDDKTRIEISATTGWITLHVDPAGCRDIDDAIAWHPTEHRWAIVIADVAAAVAPDSVINGYARAIGATFYDLEGRVVRPMLPPTISEDAASLLPGQRRRGLALLFSDGTAATWSLCWITVTHSYTYETFATSEHAWMASGMDPHDWIASQMIRYNAAAAALLQTHGVGLLRVQQPAEAAREETTTTWPQELQHLLNERATYQATDTTKPTEQGHAGLGLPAYTHASSPLRRYADLYNQRAIKFILQRINPPTETADIADHLNTRSTANRRWTRDLTFLTHVTPGKVHTVDVVPVSATHVWVPLWGRLLRLRHEEPTPPRTRIAIFCDLTRRNWKMRVLTAPAST